MIKYVMFIIVHNFVGIGTDPVTGNNDGLEPGIIALVVM